MFLTDFRTRKYTGGYNFAGRYIFDCYTGHAPLDPPMRAISYTLQQNSPKFSVNMGKVAESIYSHLG